MLSSPSILRPELAALNKYNSGLTLEDVARRYRRGPIAKLGSNENPYGVPQEVRDAMTMAVATPHLYPDPSGRRVAQEIAAQAGLETEQVILGNGSEDLLNVLARTVLRPGDEVVTLYPSFPLHEDYARMMGAEVRRVGLSADRRMDVDRLAEAVSRPVRLTIFSNPMNPTGLWLTSGDLDRILAAQHPDSVLCLDEAYLEYALGEDFLPGTLRIAQHDKPLLILRTFSKAHGLAGLRIGYGLSNDETLIRGMNLTRTPFNVNAVAQAGALASLRHPACMETAVRNVSTERARIARTLGDLGLEVFPSRANFLFVNGGRPSIEMAEALVDEGVVVKPWKQAGFETFFRVSVGRSWENTRFLDALRKILGCQESVGELPGSA
jgi:histidinol-phosphate aminotransferase